MRLEDYRSLLIPPLDEEGFQRFVTAMEHEPVKGCSFDPHWLTVAALAADIPGATFDESDGSYARYPYGTQVGRNPLYLSGAIYPMDRSAHRVSRALARALTDVERPDVLDMCAAPGGKSIALAHIKKLGLLVSNDISRKRAGILRTNIERAGVPDAVVTCIDPITMVGTLNGRFDAIILDAPCSGSGMTRKDERMAEDWSEGKVEECALIQTRLLDAAAELVAEGGIICYSTCSYSRQEDEDAISGFLERHPDFEMMEMEDDGGLEGIGGLGHRYIPGLFEGEGQYCCLLRHKGTLSERSSAPLSVTMIEGKEFKGFEYQGSFRIIDRFIPGLERFNPIKIGYAVKDLSAEAKCPYDWDLCHLSAFPLPHAELERSQAEMYLTGQDLRGAIAKEGPQGLIVVTYRGFPLGFAKRMPGRVRNLLPKGLRINS